VGSREERRRREGYGVGPVRGQCGAGGLRWCAGAHRTLGAGKEWFKPWRTVSGREDASSKEPELQVVLMGVFSMRRFLDLVRYFENSAAVGGGSTW